MAAALAQVPSILQEISDIDAELTAARSKRDALYKDLWQDVKRVRSAVKGLYGDDSSEYELVGGTRLSERKSSAHKTNGNA